MDEVSLGIEPSSVAVGRPQGFGIEVTSISNESHPGSYLRCGDLVGLQARADVGLFLDDAAGRTMEVLIEDSQGTQQGSLILFDDGTHGDFLASDAVWTNKEDFSIPAPLGANGGTWRVVVRAGSNAGGYDNGYVAEESEGVRLVLHPEEGAVPIRRVAADGMEPPVVVAVGPEGGFTDRELDLFEANGFCRVGMGPVIMRVETAIVAVCAVSVAFCGEFLRQP